MATPNPNVQRAITQLVNWFKDLETLYVIVKGIAPTDAGANLPAFARTNLGIICQGAPLQCPGNKNTVGKGCIDRHLVPLDSEHTRDKLVSRMENLNQTFLQLLGTLKGSPVEGLFLELFRQLTFQFRPECSDALFSFANPDFAVLASHTLLPDAGRAAFLNIVNTDLHPFLLPFNTGPHHIFDTPGRKVAEEINLLLGKEIMA